MPSSLTRRELLIRGLKTSTMLALPVLPCAAAAASSAAATYQAGIRFEPKPPKPEQFVPWCSGCDCIDHLNVHLCIGRSLAMDCARRNSHVGFVNLARIEVDRFVAACRNNFYGSRLVPMKPDRFELKSQWRKDYLDLLRSTPSGLSEASREKQMRFHELLVMILAEDLCREVRHALGQPFEMADACTIQCICDPTSAPWKAPSPF